MRWKILFGILVTELHRPMTIYPSKSVTLDGITGETYRKSAMVRNFAAHETHHMTCLKWRNIKSPATMSALRVEVSDILGRNHFQLSTAVLAARK